MPSKVGSELVLFINGGPIPSDILPNGNFVMLYAGSSNYYVQLINANGTLLGNPIQSTGSPMLVVLTNGNFVVKYYASSGNYAQLVDAVNGTLLGDPIEGSSLPIVTVLNNDNFVVTYSTSSCCPSSYAELISSNDGTVLRNLTQSDSTFTTALPNGNFVISYYSGSLGSWYGQLVNGINGAFIGNPIQSNYLPSVTALSNNSFMLVYENSINDYFYAQLINSNDATLLDRPVQLPGSALPNVQMLSNGNFVVTYQNSSNNYAQLVSGDGTLLGNPLQAGIISNSVYVTIFNNTFIVTYCNNGNSNYYIQIVDATNGSLRGSPIQSTGSLLTSVGFTPAIITLLPNDNFLVTYENTPDCYVQLINITGYFLGNPIQSQSLGTPTITVFTNGNFMVKYGTTFGNCLQIFSANDGSLIGNPHCNFPNVMLLSNGNLLIYNGNLLQILDVNNNGTFSLLDSSSPIPVLPNVVSLPNDNFVIIYRSGSDFYAQLFTANLMSISSIFQITTNANGIDIPSSLSNDYFLISWKTLDGNTHLQGYYVGTNLTLVNARQQLSYRQDGPIVSFNNITILTQYNTANATLTLSDAQAGVLTTSTSANITSSFIPQQGIWEASGDVNVVNDLLASTQFIPTVNYDANFTMQLSVIDEGNRTVNGTLNWIGVPTKPILQNNTLTIEEGQSVLLSNSNLQVTPITRPVTFTISNLQGGYFEQVSNLGKSILQFTQQEINAQQIRFISNRTAPVSYKVAVSDGYFNLPPVLANVLFTNPVPIVLNNPSSQAVEINQPFHFSFVTDEIFSDADGDPLTVAATSNGTALPSWVQFDASQPNQLDFSGTAPSAGSTYITLFAKDPLNASAETDFEILAVNNGTVTNTLNSNTGEVAGSVVGALIGVAAIVGGGWGFWRYTQDKNSRDGEQFANYIRESLKLKDVDNFKADQVGKQYVAAVQNLVRGLQQIGFDPSVMRAGELRELANDVAIAARNKISSATDWRGRSTITASDLNNNLHALVSEIQVLRSSVAKHSVVSSYGTS
jgi:hypothetical protein